MNKLYRPQTFEELTELLKDYPDKPLFYSGGTEIMADYRLRKIKQAAWIDIKQLPGMIELSDDTIGACVPLNELISPRMFYDVGQFVADRTVRNHLTIGGNVCGKLPFREAVLPLLAMEAEVTIFSEGEMIRQRLEDRFDKFLRLEPGELVYQFHLDRSERPYRHNRYTTSSVVDYPLMTYLAVKADRGYFVGLSGYGSVPQYGWFDEWKQDDIFNHFQAVTNDRGSSAYREKLLRIELAKGAPDEAV
ncbi:MAG TPA: hypothetical protein GXZ74_04345 [Tissierellia bacterium]|nr:hypothetical protein [Tissierellia bacterium]